DETLSPFGGQSDSHRTIAFDLRHHVSLSLARLVIDELDQEDELPGTMLCDLEERVDRVEPGPLREARRDLLAGDPANRRDLDLARRQRVPASDLHVRSLPDPHAAGDLAASDPGPECLGELHRSASRTVGNCTVGSEDDAHQPHLTPVIAPRRT